MDEPALTPEQAAESGARAGELMGQIERVGVDIRAATPHVTERHATTERWISDDTAADDALLLRREDLSVLASLYLRHSRSAQQWGGVAAALGGLALGPVLITLGAQLGWSSRLEPFFFLGGWAVFLTFGALVWRRERQLRQQYELRCPSCDGALLNGIRDRAGIALVELIAATGTCPHCHAQILAP